MKFRLRSQWLRVLCATLALVVACGLPSGRPSAAVTYFPGFAAWQQNSYHGMGIGGMSDKDWTDFQSTGANLARVFVMMSLNQSTGRYELNSKAFTTMDSLVSQASKRNIKLLPTFDVANKGPSMQYWVNQTQQASMVSAIGQFTDRYAGNQVFAGYDILNEPAPGWMVKPQSAADAAWLSFSSRIIDRIRSKDPTRVIIWELGRGDGNYTNLQPIPYGGIVYSSHWYTAVPLTHQGVKADYSQIIPYPTPSTYSTGALNRDIMKSKMQPLHDWQLKYNKPIYFGEFSCARWAPGTSSAQWAEDVSSIFNEFGWNWTFHQFRGYRAWDAELAHGGLNEVRSMNTDLMTYLRQQFAQRNP